MATIRQQLTGVLNRLRKPASPKPKPGKPARAKRVPAPKKTTGEVRHDLGKAQLRWSPWRSMGAGRLARYATGLNGDIEGATMIILFIERDGSRWTWKVNSNNYSNLLPRKFNEAFGGEAPTSPAAKLFAEKAVGLS